MKQKWPWSRKTFARGLERIATGNPAVIALDFTFSEPGEAEEDRVFRETLEKIKIPVICGAHLDRRLKRRKIGDMEVVQFQKALQKPVFEGLEYGLINIPTDSDGVIRKTELFQIIQGEKHPSFALKIFREYKKELEYPRDREIYINYNHDFQKVSFYQVYNGLLPEKIYQDKIIVIGPTFASAQDFHLTPLGGNNRKMAGVKINIQALGTLLRGRGFTPFSMEKELIFLLTITSLMILIFLFFSKKSLKILFFFLLLSGTYGFIFIQFYFYHQIPPFWSPGLLILSLSGIFVFLQHTQKNKELSRVVRNFKETPFQKIEEFCREYDITRREKEIILMILEGETNTRISKKLFISPYTVKKHISNIYQKTGFKDREELIGSFR
jgi:CHASE2 domain-containing sensor protein/DNA-binding CsgD family transcriptional regulator